MTTATKIDFKKTGLYTDVNAYGYTVLKNGERVGEITPTNMGFVVQARVGLSDPNYRPNIWDIKTLADAKKIAKTNWAD